MLRSWIRSGQRRCRSSSTYPKSKVKAAHGTEAASGAPALPSAIAFVTSGTNAPAACAYAHDTADYGIWQNVCNRCRGALREMGISPPAPDSSQAGALSRRPNNELADKLAQAAPLPWLLLISALVITADRLTKTWIAAHIRLGGAIPIIPHFLRLTHWTNEGAAFSLFADTASPHLVRWALVAFTRRRSPGHLRRFASSRQPVHAHHRRSRAHSRRRARQCSRPHPLRLSHRLH